MHKTGEYRERDSKGHTEYGCAALSLAKPCIARCMAFFMTYIPPK